MNLVRGGECFVGLSILLVYSPSFDFSTALEDAMFYCTIFLVLYLLFLLFYSTLYPPDQSGKGMLQHFSAWRQCRHCRTAILAAFLFFRRSATAAAVGICRSRPEKRGIGHGSSGQRGHSYYVILTACDVTFADVTSAGAGWNL